MQFHGAFGVVRSRVSPNVIALWLWDVIATGLLSIGIMHWAQVPRMSLVDIANALLGLPRDVCSLSATV